MRRDCGFMDCRIRKWPFHLIKGVEIQKIGAIIWWSWDPVRGCHHWLVHAWSVNWSLNGLQSISNCQLTFLTIKIGIVGFNICSDQRSKSILGIAQIDIFQLSKSILISSKGQYWSLAKIVADLPSTLVLIRNLKSRLTPSPYFYSGWSIWINFLPSRKLGLVKLFNASKKNYQTPLGS